MNGLLDAVSLLTRVPTRAGGDLRRALPWFPVVGCMIGVTVAGVYGAALLVMPALLSATVAIAIGIIATGALHEDGLADTSDAFGAGVARERTLEILKDPRLGTYGVIALLLSVLLRASALSTLTRWAALAALPATHALSRTSSLAVMALAPAASRSGLGADYGVQLTRPSLGIAGGFAATISVGLLGVWSVAAIAITSISTLLVMDGAKKRIGGVTGDVLGAAEQLTEIGVLLFVAAVAGHLPWWD